MKSCRLRGWAATGAILAALAAVGCGGGGGEAVQGAPAAAPAGAAGSSAGYVGGGEQRLAFEQLNASRLRCGFGPLEQSPALDQAASAHANYMSANGELGHGETPGRPGFTGATPLERALAAGYSPRIVGEDIAAGGSFEGSTAADSVRNLLAAPYHARSLLTGFRDVGLAWSVVNGLDTLTVNLGLPASAPAQAVAGVATYPCEGTTDAVARSNNETPSPFPDEADPQWGQPITVAGPESLRITSATVTGPSGPVPIRVIYGSGATADPNATFTGGWFSVIPQVLQPGTGYAVALEYTVGGAPGSRRFSFTTSVN